MKKGFDHLVLEQTMGKLMTDQTSYTFYRELRLKLSRQQPRPSPVIYEALRNSLSK